LAESGRVVVLAGLILPVFAAALLREFGRWRLVTPTVVVGLLISAPVVLIDLVWTVATSDSRPPEIVGFAPVQFREEAAEPFFYSIGRELRYGTAVDPAAETIGSADPWTVYPAPDGRHAVAVNDGRLFLVDGPTGRRRDVARVWDLPDDSVPEGARLFRYYGHQWSRDSASLFLVRDAADRGSHSEEGELCRLDLATGSIESLIRPYRGCQPVQGENGRIYFSEPDRKGKLRVRCWAGAEPREVLKISGSRITLAGEEDSFTERPFFVFSSYAASSLVNAAVDFRCDWSGSPQDDALVMLGTRELLRIQPGRGKGHPVGVDPSECFFLPGGRYFFLSIGGKPGPLLFDLETGQYRVLPRDTRIHPRLDSDDLKNVVIAKNGVRGEVDVARIR
jgi:hypothetical protein